MANISSYNQLSSWNEDDDLLFVQQPDAPKKAHPSQMKQYVEAGDFEATGEVIDGHSNVLNDIATRINKNSLGNIIDILSYSSSSNRYTCPSDGYVKLIVTGGGSGWVFINGQILLSSTGSSSGNAVAMSIYVRKGMTVYITGGSSVALYFIPII